MCSAAVAAGCRGAGLDVVHSVTVAVALYAGANAIAVTAATAAHNLAGAGGGLAVASTWRLFNV